MQNLVERGLLSRGPNPEDARSYLLELTAKGKRFHDRGSIAHERAKKRLERELGRPLSEVRGAVVELRRAAARALDDA